MGFKSTLELSDDPVACATTSVTGHSPLFDSGENTLALIQIVH